MVDTVLRFPVLDGSGFLYSRCSNDTSTTALSLSGVGRSCKAPAGRRRSNFWSGALNCITVENGHMHPVTSAAFTYLQLVLAVAVQHDSCMVVIRVVQCR
jgi:hypothetical protein